MHKTTKRQDYEELWEKRLLERERQREKLNKEYVDKLYFNHNLLRKGQASAAYENAIKEK